MGPLITATLATALTKLSTSPEAMDNRMNEMSKTSTSETLPLMNNLTIFRNIKQSSRRGALFCKMVVKTQMLPKLLTGIFTGRFRGDIRGFRGPRPNYPRPQQQNQNQSSYTPRQQPYQDFPQQKSNSFFQPQSSSFQPQNQNFQKQNFENQKLTASELKFSTQPSFKVFTPNPNYMPCTHALFTCRKCGYPIHLATNSTIRKNSPRRGAQNPFNQNSRKLITQHKDQSPNML